LLHESEEFYQKIIIKEELDTTKGLLQCIGFKELIPYLKADSEENQEVGTFVANITCQGFGFLCSISQEGNPQICKKSNRLD
jgi:hypothetical protein